MVPRFALAALVLSLACGDDSGGSSSELCDGPADCDDGTFCNGFEVCMPGVPGSGEDGCRPGRAPCFAAQTCDETARQCVTRCELTEDADGDGHAALECGGDDCDDADGSRFPGNVEVCDTDGRDEDCNPTTLGDLDVDGDGYVAALCCNPSAGGTPSCGDDCDDSRYGAQPGFPELCDDLDNDCDGDVDEETSDVPWYVDEDGDGFGVPGDEVLSCSPVEGRVLSDTDCDDGEPSIQPAAVERCDGLDQDCDGAVDEGTCVGGIAVSVAGSFTLNGVTPDAATCAAAGVTDVRFAFDGGEGAVAFEQVVPCGDAGFDTRPANPLLRGSYRLLVEARDDSATVLSSQELVLSALPPLTHLALPRLSLRVGGVCTSDLDCEDGNFCNGFERCDRGIGRCIPVDPLDDGTVCEADGDAGTLDLCVDGVCQLATCGDGVVSASLGEECDDGNLTPEDGCDASCLGDHECVLSLAPIGDAPGLMSVLITRDGRAEREQQIQIVGEFIDELRLLGNDSLALCGGRAYFTAYESDRVLVASVSATELREEAPVSVPNPLAVACAEDAGLLFVLSASYPGDTSATLRSYSLPLEPGATPLDTLSFRYDTSASGLVPRRLLLQRRPGRNELVTLGAWGTSLSTGSSTSNTALRLTFASGTLALGERRDIGADEGELGFDPTGNQLIQAASDGLAVWPMGATLPTAGSRRVGGGSGGSTFDLHGGSRFALGGSPVVIGDIVGGVPTQTTSFFESNEEVVWVYDGTMLATLANAPQAYAVSADGSTAMRLRTNFAGISRTYATEKYRCAER